MVRPCRQVPPAHGPWAWAVAAAFVVLAHSPARAAPGIRPWVPPNADSMRAVASEARVRFRANTGDSVGGANYRGYDLVGSMGRRLLQSLGRDGMIQAHAVEALLDSLGLDTEVALDPTQPHFALLMVRNPFRMTAAAVGFLYWYRDRDLRQQGIVFHGTRRPRMRVWWTARSENPYECGVVSESLADGGRQNLLLLRLNGTATFWMLIQYEGSGPDLGSGEAQWVEINQSGSPELVVWTRAEADSTFEECASCPHLVHERIYVERDQGYELFDTRLVPSPYAAFTLFIRLLQHQNRGAASRLLDKPSRVADAVAEGWGRRGRSVWSVEYAEEAQAWPRWFEARFRGPQGIVHYIVRFVFRDGRWLIGDWVIPRPASLGKGVAP